jgi:hypothetical protein
VNILEILKSKATNAEQLRAKLERLRNEQPLARIPALDAARREALMAEMHSIGSLPSFVISEC